MPAQNARVPAAISRISRYLAAFGLVWLVTATFIQHGWGGGAILLRSSLAVATVLLAWKFRTWLWCRRAWWMVPALLSAWIYAAGSYSYWRDAAAIVIATAIAFFVFASPPRSLSLHLAPRHAWFSLVWFVLSWALVSAADRLSEEGSLEKTGKVVAPVRMPAAWKDKRIGLSLSGGGYRAALVHAGVLEELALIGVPVTHLSTVSGGSIIGSFVATGGAPADFITAVKKGRFRFTRDLTWTWNAVRLLAAAQVPCLDVKLWPLSSFSRLDVQAELLDRVLLGGINARDLPRHASPELIVNSTDLRHGLSVGFIRDDMMLAGPAVNAKVLMAYGDNTSADLLPAYFKKGMSLHEGYLPRLSQRVTSSGAFPGAFPTRELDVAFASWGQIRRLRLALSDGGVRDNLGLTGLMLANQLAREPNALSASSQKQDAIDGDWKLDLLIASNGGQSLQTSEELSGLGALMRAVDLSGLETGAVRYLPSDSKKPPIILLTENQTIALTPEMAVVGRTPDELKARPGDYLRRDIVDDAMLLGMAKIVPDPAIAKLAERLPGARNPQQSNCVDAATTEYACLRADVVKAIGDDLWRAYSAFRKKSTLDDKFQSAEVDEIVRYGRYLVRIRGKAIATALNGSGP